MQIKYGSEVLRPAWCVQLVEPPPPSLRKRFTGWLHGVWRFLCETFWPCFWFAVAVTLLRHAG
jgi:hypothetical protein